MLKIVYINHAQIQKLVLVKINQILVMITVVIIKEALCFCKSEPFLSDDDSITENEDMNKIISVVLMSIIFRLQNTECNINSFKS